MVTMIAGSSASQHVPREKRLLRPSSYMAEEINSGDEERMNSGLNFPALSEGITGALKSDGKLEASMPKVDQNSNAWFDLLNKVNSWGQSPSKSEIEAASAKLNKLMTKNTEQEITKNHESVKIDEEVPGTVKTVGKVAVSKWVEENPDKFLEMSARDSTSVTEFFEKPLVKIYIDTHPKESNKILKAALNRFGESKLKIQLLAMLDSGAAKETTQTVLIKLWESRHFSAEDVFEFLKLYEAGRNKRGSLRWSAWISYTIQSNNKNEIYASQLLYTRLKMFFDYKEVSAWINSIETSFPEFVTALEAAWKNEKAALPPNKRRRIDDGT